MKGTAIGTTGATLADKQDALHTCFAALTSRVFEHFSRLLGELNFRAETWANLGQTRPTPLQHGQSRAEFARLRTEFGRPDRPSSDLAKAWPSLAQIGKLLGGI